MFRAGAGGEGFLMDALHILVLACYAGMKGGNQYGSAERIQFQAAIMNLFLTELAFVSVIVIKWHMLLPQLGVAFLVAQKPLGIM